MPSPTTPHAGYLKVAPTPVAGPPNDASTLDDKAAAGGYVE